MGRNECGEAPRGWRDALARWRTLVAAPRERHRLGGAAVLPVRQGALAGGSGALGGGGREARVRRRGRGRSMSASESEQEQYSSAEDDDYVPSGE